MADAGSAAGEAGGIFAGAVALLVVIGKGAAWLINWKDTREQTRSAKLQIWHEELKEREEALDERVDRRMEALESQLVDLSRTVDKWRTAFHLVAAELLQRHPQSVALMQAQKILAEAFPLHLHDMNIPGDMQKTLDRIG